MLVFKVTIQYIARLSLPYLLNVIVTSTWSRDVSGSPV